MKMLKIDFMLLAACSLATQSAIAASGSDDEHRARGTKATDTGAIAEVVVTAQRREENQQTVPVSITALSQEQLKDRQVVDIGALSSVAPNMSFGPAYDPTDVVVGIRGLSETVPQLGVDPAVGIYIDGVYYAITAGANHAFIDMERVEVLRGPQGTLFGRNTIGGALNITTHKPTDRLEGSIEAEAGNYDTRNITGILNVPFSSMVSGIRLVYQRSEHSGYAHDTYLNTDLNNAYNDYFRGTVKIEPADNWEILLSGDYSKFRSDSAFQKFAYYDNNPALPPQAVGATGAFLDTFIPTMNGKPADLLSNYAGGSFYSNSAGVNPKTRLDQHSLTATISGEISEGVNLKSITGYNKIDRHEGSDTDGTPYAVLDIIDAPLNVRQVSEELQLFGDALDNSLQWIGGIYYSKLDGRQGDVTNLFGGTPIGFQNNLSQEDSNRSSGGFLQATYAIVPKVRVTLGARYAHDTREAENFDHVNTLDGTYIACGMSMSSPAATQADCHLSGKASFSYVPWTAGIDYQVTDDALLYFKLSKGFRSGGFQQIAPAPPAPPVSELPSFDPENVKSAEIGEKIELFEHHLRLNAAAFYSIYDSIQQSFNIVTNNGPISVTQNVGKARFQGGEIEATGLIEKLTINASAGLVEAKFTDGPNEGLPVTNVSRVTGSLNMSYPFSFDLGTLTANVGYNWRSKLYFFEPIKGNDLQSDAVSQDAFGLLDARLKFDMAAMPVSIALWGRNLSDKEYKARSTDFISGGLPYVAYIPGTPRTFGASIKYDF